MSQALQRLQAVAAADMQIDLCNQKTAELVQSLNTNVARVFRLEKEHTLIFGPRHTAAYGDWYHTKARQPIDVDVINKTTKFLARMFTLRKELGKFNAQGGTVYFEVPSDPTLLVAFTISKMQIKSGPGLLAPNKLVPQYIEAYYVARAFLD